MAGVLVLDDAQGSASRLILLAGPDEAVISSLDDLEARTPLRPVDVARVGATAMITIDRPGSYVLTGNLFGDAGMHGIEVLKSNVTIDLNGFALIGRPGSKSGIHAPSGVVNICIRNGAARGWGEHGINGDTMAASTVTDVRVGNCGSDGIRLGQGIVSSCTSRQNGRDGIYIRHGRSVVESCAVELNGGDGVECFVGTTVRDVSSSGNTGNGFLVGELELVGGDPTGPEKPGDGAVLRGCTASLNGLDGFHIEGSGNNLDGCTAVSNLEHGFEWFISATVRACNAAHNGEFGMFGGYGSIVTDCTLESNGVGGLYCSGASRISGCTATGHTGEGYSYGIGANSRSVVERCVCVGNSIGINCLGQNSRIDSNHVVTAWSADAVGMKIASSGNIVVRNSVEPQNGATSFQVGGGNRVATIRPGIASAGPWDNFDLSP